MSNSPREDWQIRLAFHAYCLKVIKSTTIDIKKKAAHKEFYEISFEGLGPSAEEMFVYVDGILEEKDDGLIHIKGLAISPELIAEAIRSLPEEKQTAVLMYYFDDMSDMEISKVLKIPRSTVQYRRKSSFRPLKKYLEDNADEDY